MIATLAGFALLVVTAWLLGMAACRVVDRVAPEAPLGARRLSSVLALPWLLVTTHAVLAPLGLFRRELVFPLLVAASLLVLRRIPASSETLQAALVKLWRDSGVVDRVLAGAVAAFAILRFGRGLLLPAIDWDGLTYHLWRAGEWVRTGGDALPTGPDSWGYYPYFMPGGDALTAIALLATHDVSLAVIPSSAAFPVLLLAVFVLARSLGGDVLQSLRVALVAGAVPSTLVFVGSTYVDTWAAASVLGAFGLAVSATRPGAQGLAPFALLAASLAASTKASALPVPLLVGVSLLVALPSSRRLTILSGLASSVAFVPHLFASFGATGNPLYPAPFPLLGEALGMLPNAQFAWLNAGGPATGVEPPGLFVALAELFGTARREGSDVLVPGPALAVLVVVGAMAAVRFRLARPLAPALAFAAILLATYFAPANVGMRQLFNDMSGRLLLPGFLVLAAPVAMLRGAWVTWLLRAAVVGSLVLSIPNGIHPVEYVTIATWLGVVLAGLVLAWFLGTLDRAGVVLAIVCAVPLVLAPGLREEAFKATESGRLWTMHRPRQLGIAAWPAWALLDRTAPAVVAVAAGWEGMGQHWYLGPLLGFDLRHAVVHVPPTQDGAVTDGAVIHADPGLLDARAWKARLLASEATHLFVMAPLPAEGAWAAADPSTFEPLWQGSAGALYEVKGDRSRFIEAPAAGTVPP